MDNPLYIRFRGRILGPYDKPKLQALARRGQLSQMHELSPDSVNWAPASTYPELFVNEEIVQAELAPNTHPQSVTDSNKDNPTTTGRRWWYRKNNSEVESIEELSLRQLLGSGMLNPEVFVWTDGMPEWISARQALGHLPVPATKQCPFCAETIASAAKKCRYCSEILDPIMRSMHTTSHNVAQQPRVKQKDPGIAAVLSFILPGLGQIYNGQIAIGIIAGIVCILFYFTIIFGLAMHIFLIFDAYSYANKLNEGAV